MTQNARGHADDRARQPAMARPAAWSAMRPPAARREGDADRDQDQGGDEPAHLERRRVGAEDVLHRAADLAHRGAVAQRLA